MRSLKATRLRCEVLLGTRGLPKRYSTGKIGAPSGDGMGIALVSVDFRFLTATRENAYDGRGAHFLSFFSMRNIAQLVK